MKNCYATHLPCYFLGADFTTKILFVSNTQETFTSTFTRATLIFLPIKDFQSKFRPKFRPTFFLERNLVAELMGYDIWAICCDRYVMMVYLSHLYMQQRWIGLSCHVIDRDRLSYELNNSKKSRNRGTWILVVFCENFCELKKVSKINGNKLYWVKHIFLKNQYFSIKLSRHFLKWSEGWG